VLAVPAGAGPWSAASSIAASSAGTAAPSSGPTGASGWSATLAVLPLGAASVFGDLTAPGRIAGSTTGSGPQPASGWRFSRMQALASVRDASEGIEVVATVTEGRPVPVLLAAAAGAELLVVGSRGHGGFAGMLLGSVSQHCVQHAACPVVVIRTTGVAVGRGEE